MTEKWENVNKEILNSFKFKNNEVKNHYVLIYCYEDVYKAKTAKIKKNRNMPALSTKTLKSLNWTLWFAPSLLFGIHANATPSQSYQDEQDCWNKYDFISPQDMKHRYCKLNNGKIERLDINGKPMKKKISLNKATREKIKTEDFAQAVSHIIEYKVENNELIKYACKAKNNPWSIQCANKTNRIRIGVRPKGFYLNQGLKRQNSGEWEKSIEDFSKQINIEKDNYAYYNRALSKFNIKDYLGSLEDINKSILLDPSNYYSYELRSQLHNNLKDNEGEIEDLTKVIKLLKARINEGKNNLDNIKNLKFIKRGSSAYLLVEGASFEEVRQRAKEIGGNLVTINNLKENRWLANNFADSSIHNSTKINGEYWIGYKYSSNSFGWDSGDPVTYSNLKIGSPSNKDTYPSFAKINLYTSNKEVKNDSGKWVFSSIKNSINNYGIAEINIATTFEEVDSKFKNIYFRRGLSKSQLGFNKAAIKDFDLAISNKPTNGQVYFQRGLEKFWINRKEACNDLRKGLSLGAEDTSSSILSVQPKSISLFQECNDILNKRSENVKRNYTSETHLKELIYILRKYYVIIPIFLIIGFYILIRQKENEGKQ